MEVWQCYSMSWNSPKQFKYKNQQLSVTWVWPTWCNHSLITAYHVPMNLWIAAISRLFHSSGREFPSAIIFVGWTGRRKISTFSMIQTCSIGLRSGEHAGQSIRALVSCWRYSSTALSRWSRALSSIRTNWVRLYQHTVWRICPGSHPCSVHRSSCLSSWCAGLFFHLWWYQPTPLWSLPHSGHVRIMLASWNRSPRLPHTRARQYVKSRQYAYLDSSVKSTNVMVPVVISPFDVILCPVQTRLFVKSGQGMRMHALLDRRPLCRRRLRTVCMEMLTPTVFLNSFRKVVAFTMGWRIWVYRSCIGVVARFRPSAWRWLAEPFVWKRIHALLITLWLTPNTLATLRCEDPHSSMPMGLDNNSVVKRRCWRRGQIQDLKYGEKKFMKLMLTFQ